jgi:hypothetical protein
VIIFWRSVEQPDRGPGTRTGWWIRGWLVTVFLLGALVVYAPVIGVSLLLTLIICHVAIVVATRREDRK